MSPGELPSGTNVVPGASESVTVTAVAVMFVGLTFLTEIT